MSLKPIIKSAREALDRKDYPYALQLCTDALEFEPDNYWLLVFKAVALGAQGETAKALNEYFKASKAPVDNPTLAFQGIVNLYETKNLELDEKYHSALESLSSLLFKQKEYEKHYALMRKRINLHKEAKNVSEVVKLLNWLSSHEALTFYPVDKVTISKKTIWREQFDLLAPLEASTIAKDIESGRMRLNSSDPLDRLIERVEVQNYSRELTEIIRNLSETDSENYLDILMKRLFRIVISDFCPSEELRREYADELVRHSEVDECATLQCLKYNLSSAESDKIDCAGPKAVMKELTEAADREEYGKVMKLIEELEKTLKKWNRAFSLEYSEEYIQQSLKLKLRALIGLNYHEDALQLVAHFKDDTLLSPLLFEPVLSVLESARQLSRAIVLIESKLMTIDPDEPGLILRLADDLIEAQRYEEAAEYLHAIPEAYTSLAPTAEARLSFATGVCFWHCNSRTPQTSLAHLLTAAKLNPLESKYFAWIGKYYWRVEGERDRALKCFARALHLESTNLQAAVLFAEASLQGPECDDSVVTALLKPFTKLSQQARNRRLFYYHGIALFNSSNFIDASVAFQSALKGSLHYEDSSDPPISDENCLQWAGESFLRSNRLGSAEKAFSRLAALDPASVVAHVGLADVHLKSNSPIEAVDCLDSIKNVRVELSAKVNADKAQALLSLARHYLRQGRFISAVRATVNSLQAAQPFESPEALRLASDALTLAHSLCGIQGFKFEHFVPFIIHASSVEINPGLVTINQLLSSSGDHELVVSSVKFALSALSEAFKDSSKNNLAPHWLQLAVSLSKASKSMEEFVVSACENAFKSVDATPSLKGQAHHIQALLFFKDPKLKRQVQHHLISALKLQPEASQLWTDLGRFYLQAGDWELAAEGFKRALAVDQEDLVAAFELARSSGTVEGAEAAIQVAQRAFTTQPVHFTEDFAICLAGTVNDGGITAQYAQIYLNRLHNTGSINNTDIPTISNKLELLEYLNASEDPKVWCSSAASELDCEFLLKRPENEVTQSGWRAVVEGLLPSLKERTCAELEELSK